MNLGFASLGYLLLSSLVGVYVSRKVNSVKGFAVANRSLPLYVSTATVFATWFGSESILGIPGAFLEHGVVGMMADPIAASLYLILVGLFLAKRFYKMNVTTIAEYFKNRYDTKVSTFLGLCISASYFGWIAAQLIAFGFVLSFLTNGAVTPDQGKAIAAVVAVLYTFKGGMMSVAYNDFVQAAMIVFGLIIAAITVTSTDVEFMQVINFAMNNDRFDYQYNEEYPTPWHVVGIMLVIICGCLPQQDTYQRITSADSEKSATLATIFGGFVYFMITMIPIYLVLSGILLGFKAPDDNSEIFLIHFIAEKNNFVVQVFFFGALMAAILSTIAGTTLASSVVLSENVIGTFTEFGYTLKSLRISLVLCTSIVLWISLVTTESIHSLASGAGKIAFVSAFWPLMFGMFVPSANAKGALYSAVLGTIVWVALEMKMFFNIIEIEIASELVGFAVSLIVLLFFTYVKNDGKAKIAS